MTIQEGEDALRDQKEVTKDLNAKLEKQRAKFANLEVSSDDQMDQIKAKDEKISQILAEVDRLKL